MRSKAFLGIFVITQLVMVVATMGIVGSEGGSSNNSEELTMMFWGAIAIPFLIFQPLLAIESIHSEVKHKTLEMLYLSRLSSRRIILGKFYSHMLQTLMIACTIMPYVVLRYFAGGVNLLMEISTFISIVLISALGTAISVSTSSFSVRHPRSHRVRILILLILIVVGSTTGFGMFTAFMRFGGGGSINWVDFVTFVLMVPFVIYQVLSLGMSQVAPVSENNLLHKRINCFAVLAIYIIFRYFCESFLPLLPVMVCFLMSALEGVFSGDANYRSSYQPVKKYPEIGLLVAPNRYAYFNWFNLAVLMSLMLMVLEIANDDLGGNNKAMLILAPLICLAVYFTQMQLAQKEIWANINNFFIVFFLPFTLFLGMGFNDSLDSVLHNDAYEVFAVSYIFYANIMISYGLALQISRWKKEKLNTMHVLLAVISLIIIGTISLILKSIFTHRVDEVMAFFPLELFPVMLDNNETKGIALGSIVHLQLFFSLLALHLMSAESAKKFFQFREEGKDSTDEVDQARSLTEEL
ncbi:hypothetical protein PQO03_00160 [Lentisphaera profundi]|uniref:Uncharacterized protein n=1 Tax=Lentisphaera profundi TaxID=1658616 RepID=A0ABY7VQB5_9BACT|nr:hypothetical protein [Lentisphaera profundi]WDE96381.1 hypothetical protein PQO03_00160 [Lentisphaera profundi]